MRLRHRVCFEIELGLDRTAAVAFVRDVEGSLARADFLRDLTRNDDGEVRATLPVNAALFGQQQLRFVSRVAPTPQGARLVGLDLDDVPGWARVSGEATVLPRPKGCVALYRFDIEIHLELPEPERWGGRALTKMIELTAARVLERICARFPDAVREAARAYEATFA